MAKSPLNQNDTFGGPPDKTEDDVAYEVALCGGLEGWIKHYGLINRNGDSVPACGGYKVSEYEEEYRRHDVGDRREEVRVELATRQGRYLREGERDARQSRGRAEPHGPGEARPGDAPENHAQRAADECPRPDHERQPVVAREDHARHDEPEREDGPGDHRGDAHRVLTQEQQELRRDRIPGPPMT